MVHAIPVGRWRWLPLLAMLAVAFLALPAPHAEAHRDGCHRWHSCPSDTGSYVCGDLGYYNECPGGKPDSGSTSPSTESDDDPPDLDPPSAPKLRRATSSAGGRVEFRVRAEKGSKIRVDTDAGNRVAKTTATGKDQKIKFKAKSGRRTYVLTATDKAGNESVETTKTVAVDATPPKLTAVSAVAGTESTGASTLSFTSDPGATWTLTGAGGKALHGIVSDPTVQLTLWLPDGTYKPSLTVRDKTGNASRKAVTLREAVPHPLLQIDRTSAPTEKRLVYALTGTPRSAGSIVLAHLDDIPFRIDDQGVGAIAVDAADGTYGPGQVVLTDFAGRRASQDLPETVVDTAAPTLDLEADQPLAKTGTLAISVAAEEGSSVHLTARMRDTPHGDEVNETFRANAAAESYVRQPAAGTYTITATATDAVGNTTTRQIDIDLVIPATPAQIVLAIAILVWLCALPIVAAVLLWHYRGRISDWRAKLAEGARKRASIRAEKAAQAAYQRQLATHQKDVAAYKTAELTWKTERTNLAELLTVAQTFAPATTAGELLKLKRNETCYGSFPATMVEDRTRQGVTSLTDTETGRAVITSQRIVFVADHNREWIYAKLGRPATSGNLTMLPVSNRKQVSGVRVTSAAKPEFDLRFALAQADRTGSRSGVVAQHEAALARHDQHRPTPPKAPQPPPTPDTTPKPDPELR